MGVLMLTLSDSLLLTVMAVLVLTLSESLLPTMMGTCKIRLDHCLMAKELQGMLVLTMY